MIFRRLQTIFQMIGFVTVAVLMIHGGVVFISGDPYWYQVGLARTATAAGWASGGSQMSAALAAGALDGQIPRLINYQGSLRDQEGNLMSGEFNITFRIYSDVAAQVADAAWTGDYSAVTVREGRFSVILGDVKPDGTANPFPDSLFSSVNYFVGVTVEGYDEMWPRLRFVSVPYAIVAEQAYALAIPDGGPDAQPAVAVAPDGQVNINSGGQGRVKLENYNNASAQLSRWTDRFEIQSTDRIRFSIGETPGISPNKMTIEANGNIGIGTDTPTHKLHVKADGAVGLFESTASQAYLRLSANDGFDNRVEIANRGNGLFSVYTPIGDSFWVDRNGSVTLGNNANSSNTVNGSLTVNGSNTVNGNATVSNALTVNGEIWGDLHTIGTVGLDTRSPQPKTQSKVLIYESNGFCFLSRVGGSFQETHRHVNLSVNSDGLWVLYVEGPHIYASATCVGK